MQRVGVESRQEEAGHTWQLEGEMGRRLHGPGRAFLHGNVPGHGGAWTEPWPHSEGGPSASFAQDCHVGLTAAYCHHLASPLRSLRQAPLGLLPAS